MEDNSIEKDNRSESKNPLPFKKQGWYGYRKRRNMYYSQKLGDYIPFYTKIVK